MSILIYGDAHGDWRPLRAAMVDAPPVAIVLLGDCDLARPLHVELGAAFRAGIDVFHIYGNHEKDTARYWDNLVGDHPSGSLHAKVQMVGSFAVAGIAGVFKASIWLPPAAPTFISRAELLRGLRHQERWRGGVPLRRRDAIFPEDFDALGRLTADILVTHEAPATHLHGFAALGALARSLKVRIVVHGHHHTSLDAINADGIRVIGLGKAEVLRLSPGDVP